MHFHTHTKKINTNKESGYVYKYEINLYENETNLTVNTVLFPYVRHLTKNTTDSRMKELKTYFWVLGLKEHKVIQKKAEFPF